jgi:hypothetical protein
MPSVQIGVCTFEWHRDERYCRTIFPDGQDSRVDVPSRQSRRSLDKWKAWGYPRSPDGVLTGLIEHEALHTWVAVNLWGLPWSPELRSVSLGQPNHVLPAVRPDFYPPRSSISFEEGVVIALQLWLTKRYKSNDWSRNKSWAGRNPLSAIDDLPAFTHRARRFLALLRDPA